MPAAVDRASPANSATRLQASADGRRCAGAITLRPGGDTRIAESGGRMPFPPSVGAHMRTPAEWDAGHLRTGKERSEGALKKSDRDHLIVAAGIEKMRFLDDMPVPFVANPQFKAWVPLLQHPHSWIVFTPGERPKLIAYQPDDYWHVPPSAP